MYKFIRWLETWLPCVWGILAIFTVTGLLIASSISVIQWILRLLGVL